MNLAPAATADRSSAGPAGTTEATPAARRARNPHRAFALRELGLIAAFYLAYTGARTLADGDLGRALERAAHLIDLEHALHLPSELWLNRIAAVNGWLGLAADYWYATAHYLVTALVLAWLFRRGRDVYVPARRALAAATLVALGFYLMMPTAPPRMVPGFTDVMALHSDIGWWGANASAPKGLGGLTNELAAFPSMHAGWALWVALAVWSASRSRVLRSAGVLYALVTGIVVIATANHWVVDVVVGQMLVLAAWVAVGAHQRASRTTPAGSGARAASLLEAEAA